MTIKTLIHITILFGTTLLLTGCSCSSSKKDTKEPELKSKTCTIKESNISYNTFIFDKWLNDYCTSINNEDVESILRKSFETYNMRLLSFLQEQSYNSIDFLTENDTFIEFLNSIIMGKVSAKSLEQIINTQVDKLIVSNPNLRIHHVYLENLDKSSILPSQSVEYLLQRLEDIENMDISKKERKIMRTNEIHQEILRNICKFINEQNLINQF